MITVIGDKKTILPFRAFGISTFEAKSPVEAKEILSSVAESGIVFITEELVEGEPPANVTVIPGIKGSLGHGERIVKEVIKRATGAETGDNNG